MSSGYLMDGDDLSDIYGIEISKVKGPLDHPKRKGKTFHSWLDENGVEHYTETDDIKFKERDLIFYCFIKNTTSKADFLTKLNNFKIALRASGLRTMTLPYVSTTFEVFFKDGFIFNMLTKWSATTLVGTFVLKLCEPSPALSVS